MSYSSKLNFKDFSTKEKFDYLHNNQVSDDVINYLSSRFVNLEIHIYNECVLDILELMRKNIFQGWCFQTTEIAGLFMDDDSYVVRGVLRLNKNKKYYHSWIFFNYKGNEYVFDPCLNFVVVKYLYDLVFDVEVRGVVNVYRIKECFIDYVNNSIKKDFFIEDVNDPMYRNKGISYKMETEGNKVKKLVAYYLD